MTVNYTTNLALGQPVTGTESGTWGDDVNNSVTSYLDIAIAGGLSVTVTTADVTLTLTQGTSSATNIGSTTAQYAILNVSGAMTAARNLILPSSSRQYVINNNTTGGFALTVKGSATSGVTMVNGEKAHVFWNGSDYAKLSNTPGGAGTFSSITNTGLTSGRVVYSTTGGLETDSANLTFDGTNLTLAGGTANGVTYLNGSKVLTTGSALTFDGTILTGPQLRTTNAVGAIFNTAAGAYAQWQYGAAAVGDIGTANQVVGSGATTDFAITSRGASGNLVFGINTTEAMRLTSTGLGIGTSSPAAKLNVASSNGSVYLDSSTALAANNGMTLNWRSVANSGGTLVATASILGAKENATGDNYAGYMSFTTTSAGGSATERMRIDSSGNVGIGMTPVYQFDITTGASNGIRLNASSGQVNIILQQAGVTNGSINAGGGAGTDLNIYATRSLNLVSGTGALITYVNSAERMRIDTSGNVGIGTSSPTVKLQVAGGAAIQGAQFPSAGAGIELSYNSGSGLASIQAYDRTGAAWKDIEINALTQRFGTSGTERMRIDSSGNLGIGVTPSAWGSAAKALQIGAFSAFYQNISGYPEMSFNSYETTTAVYKYQVSGNTASLYSQSGAYHRWYIAPSGTAGNTIPYTQAMTLDASGNLLVGTTSVLNTSLFSLGGNFALSGGQMNMSAGQDFEFVMRSAYKMLFYVNASTVVANLSITGVWTNASDARYKENITDSPYGLATVMALKPRAYNLINLEDKPQIGFIAQEVIDLVPEVVESVHNSVTNEDRYTLSYGNMVAVLTKAIQEQQALITSLTARITALEST